MNCVCVFTQLYLPSCIVQGSIRAHSVLSQYLHNPTSLNSCIFVASTTSTFNVFQLSTILCRICIFLCPLDTDSFLTSLIVLSSVYFLFFFHHHQVLVVQLFNSIYYLIYTYQITSVFSILQEVAVPFPLICLHN